MGKIRLTICQPTISTSFKAAANPGGSQIMNAGPQARGRS